MSGVEPGRSATPTVARVLVDSPLPQLDRLLDYRIPESLMESARPGVRVRVSLRAGGRIVNGWLIETVDSSEYGGTLSELNDVISPIPVLTPDVWRLVRALADRAAGNASGILRIAIPSRQVRVEKAWLAEHEAAASTGGESAAPLPRPVTGYPSGRIEAALAAGERIAVAAIPRVQPMAPASDAPISTNASLLPAWASTLAEAAAHTLAADRSSILLVPDYRDQEQLETGLAALIDPARVVRIDAKQTGSKRYRAFLRATESVARVIIGNRSAIYAPATRLGLIAMWDDGDPLYAEPLSPGVHARDAALIRQQQSGAALMVLSHARSVATQRLVELGWLTEVMPSARARPKVVLTPAFAESGMPARIPSPAWRAASAAVHDGPVLVQVAHPGYASTLVCVGCEEPAGCVRCGGPLVLPEAGGIPRCRLCGALAGNWSCPNCDEVRIRPGSPGSVRTADELGRAFPGVRVLVSDGERQLLRVSDEPALVVATRGAEPVAESGYRAILLLDGDRMLLREALSVAEDCVRWWSNAAALAAPEAPVYLVGVTGRVGTALATWRQESWAADELAARRALRFPPAVRTASVTARAEILREALTAVTVLDGVDVLGPVPAADDLQRAIVRFDYAHGVEVARALRAEAIRVATTRRRPVVGPVRRPPTLRIRFDEFDID